MMRLDKFLVENEICSRSEAKKIVKNGLITINGTIAKSSDLKIDESGDCICYRGKQICYEQFSYYLLNKPDGYVCSNQEKDGDIVFKLLGEDNRKDFSCVGRLDKDTTGLLLITNDGSFHHLLVSPKRHVDKTYVVTLEKEVTEEDLQILEQGVDIGDEEKTLPAKAIYGKNCREVLLTIHEGRYHQVKRMFSSLGNKVVALHRSSFGPICLNEEELERGSYRRLTEEEKRCLYECCDNNRSIIRNRS